MSIFVKTKAVYAKPEFMLDRKNFSTLIGAMNTRIKTDGCFIKAQSTFKNGRIMAMGLSQGKVIKQE